MELWIRSQDRAKLCEARFFELDNDKTGIFCFNGESYSVFAGKYKTKERALEVLDEIQNILQPRVITHEPVIDYDDMFHSLSENVAIHCTQQIETELKQAGQVVYQMPLD